MPLTRRLHWIKAAGSLAASLCVLAFALPTLAHTKEAPLREAPAACASECFVLTSMLIQGVSAYPLAELAGTYDQKLASQVDVSDLVQSATAITELYRSDGYFLTRAAVVGTDPTTGSAQIVVYEGYISDVQIEGAGAGAVAPILNPLKGRRPLTIAELDRRLALAADIPGMTLKSRIEPVIEDPAQHRLIVETSIDRVVVGAYADNRGSETQGPWQVYLSGAYNSALTQGDQLSLAVLSVPDSPSELTYAEAAYSAGLATGGRVRFSVSGYRTDAPTDVQNGWVGGRSRMASLSVSHPLIRSRTDMLSVSAGLDVRRVEQRYVAAGQADETLTVARVTLSGQKRSQSGYVTGSLQASQGIDAFGATTQASNTNTRSDATGQFTKINARVSGYRDVGKHAGLFVEAAGQWSADPLLGAEEFFVGGPAFGRAYDYGEISGDKGVAIALEARVGVDPPGETVSFVQAYAFVDAAKVWNKTPGPDWSRDLTSAGVGTRVTIKRETTLRLEFAKPLSDRPFNEPDNGWRTFVSLSKQF